MCWPVALAISTMVGSSGTQDIYAGGSTASGAMVSAYGDEYVNFGGTAVGTTLGSGWSASSSLNRVAPPRHQRRVEQWQRGVGKPGGTASFTTVSSGGTEFLSSGADASDTAVNVGGSIDLVYLPFSSGGSAMVDPSDSVDGFAWPRDVHAATVGRLRQRAFRTHAD